MSDQRLPNALVVDDDITGRSFLRALPGGLAGERDEVPARVIDALHEFRRGTQFAEDVTVVELYPVPALFESIASAAGGKGLARPVKEAA